MKSSNLVRLVLRGIALTTVGSILFLASCKKDEPTPPAPSISVTTASASGLAGAKVTTSVTVDAPGGGKTLFIYVNGAASSALPNVTLDGTNAQTVPVEYTIPANAVVGSTIIISFQASDNNDLLSAIGSFTVTVSDVPSKPIVEVTADITTDTHWTADKIYRLNGFIRVGTDKKPGAGGAGVEPVITATATLTIDPGTVIYGKTGTPGGALVIQRGSKIIANGTAAKPIIFTSDKAPGSRKAGDWAGLVLCGKATNNVKASASTGKDGVEELEGAYGAFHGGGGSLTPNDADNSGVLTYVRVEYAGYPINPNQEINGITFGSIGSGTTVDHVQVSYANDDSYEWFGGKVNATYLVAYKGIDDDFDTDNGFSGKVQFGLGVRDPLIADQSGSNGFECDNDANGTSNTPFTDATFSNMTIIGGKATSGTTINIQFQNGAQIRRNAKQDIINSFITGYPNGIYIDNALPGTIANATAGELVIKNNILAGVEGWGGNGFGSAATADEQTAFGLSAAGSNHPNNPRGFTVVTGVGAFTNGAFSVTTAAQISSQNAVPWFKSNNSLLQKWSDSSLGLSSTIFDPLSATPVFLPTVGSALLTGADFTGYTGFTSVTHRGAFGATDWTSGWTNWNPQVADYSK